MRLLRSVGLIALAMGLVSCGGGGTGGTAPVAPPPSPPPAAPPPPPPPPPPAVKVRAFSASAGPSFFRFGPPSPPDGAYGGRNGEYPSSALGGYGFGALAFTASDWNKVAMSVDQVDSLSSTRQIFGAPANARALSPLSSLINSIDQAKLKRALGLDQGLFAFATDRDLLTFDAIDGLTSTDSQTVNDAGRMLSANIRLLAIAYTFLTFDGNPPDSSVFTGSNLDRVEISIAARPADFLFTNANMTALLKTREVSARYLPEVVSATAHLIDAYAAAVPVSATDPAQRARFMLGIYGYLQPAVDRLLRANTVTAANEALTVTTQTVLDATARYAETLPFNTTGSLFPITDFYTVKAGATRLIPATDIGFNGDGPLIQNDRFVSNDNPLAACTCTVTSLIIPSRNGAEISATLNPDKTINFSGLNNFIGVTYFDYVVRLDASGETQTGRVFVRFIS